MASNIDERQMLTWFTECITAICLTKASGTTTSAVLFTTSCGSQLTADTGLTAQEKAIITSISSAIGAAATQPSSSIHSGTIG